MKEVTLRLWTHDMSCVISALSRAALYAQPHVPSSAGVTRLVMETLPRNLTIAAVAFTTQLVLEETELSAVEDGETWGSLPEKDREDRED